MAFLAGDGRQLLQMARARSERAWLARAGGTRPARARILCYHGFGTPGWGINDVEPGQFAAQVEAALSDGHRFVGARAVATGEAGPRSLALTFDDGLESIAAVLPVLAAYRLPFTICVVAAWAEGCGGRGVALDWAGLEGAMARGARIASHSMTHARLASLPDDRVAWELGESRRLIGLRLGVVPDEFAIPFGRRRDWPRGAWDVASEAGYRVVYAQGEERRPAGTTGRTFIGRWDSLRVFRAALEGRLDGWEE